MTLFSKTVAERTKPGQRQDIEEQSYTFHAYGRSEGICAIIISDQAYPPYVSPRSILESNSLRTLSKPPDCR